MPIKKFGIYLAYGPLTDFRSEGLGRLLAEFLRASSQSDEMKFVIAAPSWLQRPLRDLLANFDLNIEDFEIVSPKRQSLLGALYRFLMLVSRGKRELRHKIGGKGRLRRLQVRLFSFARSLAFKIATARNPLFIVAGVALLPFLLPLFLVFGIVGIVAYALTRSIAARKIKKQTRRFVGKVARATGLKTLSHNLYRLMCDSEAAAVAHEANKRLDVDAWFSPAAFWPEFNLIKKRRLMCVPDVVPVHFSVQFAVEHPNGERLMQDFKRIEASIDGGDRYVTYSNEIKYRTLLDRFGVHPDRVNVIPHGASRLDHLALVTGFEDNSEASDALNAARLWSALVKSQNNTKARWYASKDLGFLFYASQVRPNKNILSLLRAYYKLRREQNLPYKLILTGDMLQSSQVLSFINDKHLNDDVLFLRGLNEKELAACYRLATLCVNPSLAEGGMPFTFTEALSVGTPVIMSDIEVSREIIIDPLVAERTFFNGFDYQEIAKAITRALNDIEELYRLQSIFYENHLKSRSWKEVIREYVSILEN
jgi:glycosyltransferase involved in cell wall biosynthesis